MLGILNRPSAAASRSERDRKVRPRLEGLEDRLLLYTTLGAQWVHGSRITYSFVPDGTNVGGSSSVLFQNLNAKFPTSTWQQQIRRAAAVWQAVAKINLVEVSDNGTPLGGTGHQQGDSRFGDIRISMIPQGGGTLAIAYLPPPINGGSAAGDIVFNSNIDWKIDTDYDLQTVAIHEFGHALGLGHSTISQAVMFAAYNGVDRTLHADDSAGMQAVYGPRAYDQFNSNGNSNNTSSKAADITSYIDAAAQISIADLDITVVGQAQWFKVTVPSTTTGTMVAKVQSSNLSSLGPKVSVFSSTLAHLGTSGSNNYGATVSVSVAGVQPGQLYYVRASANGGGVAVGGFGLQVNFGSQSQPPIPPPNTVVPAQPNQGGGFMSLADFWNGGTPLPPEQYGDLTHYEFVRLGNLAGWAERMTIPGWNGDGEAERPGPRWPVPPVATERLSRIAASWGELTARPVTVSSPTTFGFAPLGWEQGRFTNSHPHFDFFEALDLSFEDWKPRRAHLFS